MADPSEAMSNSTAAPDPKPEVTNVPERSPNDCDSSDQPGPAKRSRGTAGGSTLLLCPICCEQIWELRARPENCEHSFCLDCLTSWCRGSNSCPLDRVRFDAILVSSSSGAGGSSLSPARLPVPTPLVQQQHPQPELPEEPIVCRQCRVAYQPEENDFSEMITCDHCLVVYHFDCLCPAQQSRVDEALSLDEPWYCWDCLSHHEQS